LTLYISRQRERYKIYAYNGFAKQTGNMGLQPGKRWGKKSLFYKTPELEPAYLAVNQVKKPLNLAVTIMVSGIDFVLPSITIK
jgi:hypothetical protein